MADRPFVAALALRVRFFTCPGSCGSPMKSRLGTCFWALLLSCSLVIGCRMARNADLNFSEEDENFKELTQQISYDDAEKPPAENADEFGMNAAGVARMPNTVRRDLPTEFIDLTIEDVLQIALQNATILRDLGGTILRHPETLANRFDPRIQETDPRVGVNAALSDFDAQLHALANFENNHRFFNNRFIQGTHGFLQQYHDYVLELSKRSVTGAQYTARWNTDYNANNSPGNLFPSAWQTMVEGEVRQPLLQGAGVNFNRIAGPNAQPGALRGVVIARVNADIAVTEFEIGLQNFISDVENAYWDLYFSYRNLDAKVDARNKSLQTLLKIRARMGAQNFERDKEAQAREQYVHFEQDVVDALAGRVVQGTRTNNGSTAGTFRPTSGLYVAERRLRLLLGWPITGKAVIRPATEPLEAPMVFDWETLVTEAIWQRTELKKQRQTLKLLYKELEASKNFLKPRLDAIARYRLRGFGKGLTNGTDPTGMGFNDAFSNLSTGQFQEWMAGLELNIPIGFREGFTAVRNSELQIARERATMGELKREIIHNLSDAYAEVQRAWRDTELSRTRLAAAQDRVASLEATGDSDVISINDQLNAQTHLADAQVRYASSLIDYMIAIRNVHYEKGSLFQYREVFPVNALADSNYFPEDVYYNSSEELEPLLPDEDIPDVPEPVVPEHPAVPYDLDRPPIGAGLPATTAPMPAHSAPPENSPTQRTEVPPENSHQARIEIVPQGSHPLGSDSPRGFFGPAGVTHSNSVATSPPAVHEPSYELFDPAARNTSSSGLPAGPARREPAFDLFDRGAQARSRSAATARPPGLRSVGNEPAYELFDPASRGRAIPPSRRPPTSAAHQPTPGPAAPTSTVQERITASKFIVEPMTAPPSPAVHPPVRRAPAPPIRQADGGESATIDRLFGNDPSDRGPIRFDDPRWKVVD